MMRLPCPHCGVRDVIEFTWGGEADITRPVDPASVSDSEWAAYLYLRVNPRGITHERWCHTYGCGQWFAVRRDTVSHEVEQP
ncbi:MAG TPA: sarcosine oxidase subunit delta [Steroidobacter sp.]|uniref:sarcosine oxidase subunit delta n=1 Tax=Steroidobacter sp. TaxID=1978227 RepID=UPI002EDA6ACD